MHCVRSLNNIEILPAFAGAFIMVSLAALLYGGTQRSLGAWQLAAKASGSASAQAPHGQEHLGLSRQRRSAAHRISAAADTAALNTAVRNLPAEASAGGNGGPQVIQQQAPHPMGQRHSLPATNGLDRLLLEGRFSIDRRRGQLAFEWSLSTIRCHEVAQHIGRRTCIETVMTLSMVLVCQCKHRCPCC
jgi:hypothetical protein